MKKNSFTELAGRSFTNGFSGLSRNRPMNGDSNTDLCDAGATGSWSLCATITSLQMMDMGAGMAQW